MTVKKQVKKLNPSQRVKTFLIRFYPDRETKDRVLNPNSKVSPFFHGAATPTCFAPFSLLNAQINSVELRTTIKPNLNL